MNTNQQNGVDSQYSINLDFFEAAMLNKQHDPWRRKRKPGLMLTEIEIVSSDHSHNWYTCFIGVRCMAELRFNNYSFGKFLREAVVVSLNGTSTYNSGRSISANNFIIL